MFEHVSLNFHTYFFFYYRFFLETEKQLQVRAVSFFDIFTITLSCEKHVCKRTTTDCEITFSKHSNPHKSHLKNRKNKIKIKTNKNKQNKQTKQTTKGKHDFLVNDEGLAN